MGTNFESLLPFLTALQRRTGARQDDDEGDPQSGASVETQMEPQVAPAVSAQQSSPGNPAGAQQGQATAGASPQAQQTGGAAQASTPSGPAETTATVTGRTVTIRRRANVDDAYVTVENRTGTRAFRNNNPGNIVDGDFARNNGAISTDGRFAVFPDADTGFRALNSLLRTPRYQNSSVDQAIARYAPPNENDTAAYQAGVRRAVGVSGDTQLSDLSAEQMDRMAQAIARIEGYHQGGAVTYGTEGHVPARPYATTGR